MKNNRSVKMRKYFISRGDNEYHICIASVAAAGGPLGAFTGAFVCLALRG